MASGRDIMYEWLNVYAHQRVNELHQDREKLRIIRQALEARGEREPFYAPLMAHVGRQLSSWGEQLQERYADAPERVAAQ
jgi:hypothetical protein